MNIDQSKNAADNAHGKDKDKEKLHIFINKIKFDETQGVKTQMTGGALADLVSVPSENAKITRQKDNKEFTVADTIDIHMGDHFEIIRKVVPAGYGK
jgi:hypothetical protein